MMKKVIFICLLSLTTCLSRPDAPLEAVTPSVSTATNPVAPQGKPTDPPAASPTVSPTVASSAATLPPTAATNASIPGSSNETTVPPTHPDSNKTNNKTTPVPDDKKTVPPVTTVAPENGTDAGKQVITTTTPPAHDKTNGTTPEAKVTTEANVPPKPAEVSARGFDGPSFIGGIILTLGLLAVGFMGFKYYRNQTERNYHTL